MIKSLFSLTLISFCIVSCKTTNKKNNLLNPADKILNIKNYKDITQVNQLKYKRIKTCTDNKKTLAKASWKNQVDIANHCIYKKDFKKLLTVANYLSLNHNNMPWGNYFKSFYYSNRNLDLKALWLIDSSIETTKNIGLFYYQKAIILNKLNYTLASQQSAQKAIELNPNNFGAQLLLGEIELHAGNYKKALLHAEFSKKLIHKNNNLNTLFADIYFETKKYTKAIIYLTKIKKADDMNDVNFKLAYSYENLDNKAKSISFYKLLKTNKKKKLLDIYGLDVNEKIKDMQVEIAKVEKPKRQPTNKDNTKDIKK